MSTPSTLQAWWLAARPKTLAAGLVPVIVGTAIAHTHGGIQLTAALACATGSILIQVGTNLANDYFDHKKGADTEARLGPDRAVQKGWISPRAMAIATACTLTLALVVGCYLISIGGLPIALIGVASLVCAIAYTGGPYPLAYVGLGDVFVFLFFGLAAVVGTTWVQTLSAPPQAWLAGSAIGLLATAILVVNNLRDRLTDAAANKRTLAVRWGEKAARREHAAVICSAFLIVWCSGAAGFSPAGWSLLTVLCIPLAVIEIRAVHAKDGAALNPHLAGAARLELFFGLALAAGCLL